MPIFEYRCQACGTAFEAFVTAERAAACPDCQSRDLAKLLSVPGMVGGGADRSEPSPAPAGGCGAGGASCACRANSLN